MYRNKSELANTNKIFVLSLRALIVVEVIDKINMSFL
jgi:hypothetical protein